MKTNTPGNNTAAPVPDGWWLAEATHEDDGQARLIRTCVIQSGNHPAPQEDPAWVRYRRTEGGRRGVREADRKSAG